MSNRGTVPVMLFHTHRELLQLIVEVLQTSLTGERLLLPLLRLPPLQPQWKTHPGAL